MVTETREASSGDCPASGRISLLVDAYLGALAAGGRASTTLTLYRGLLTRFARSLGESRDVAQLTTADITAYIATLRSKNASSSYPTTVARILRGFFTWLAETGEIPVNPMASIRPRMPAWNPVPPYSDDELRRLLTATRTPMEKAVITLLADTGMRASELASLRMDDVDLDQGMARVMGKGGKRRTLALNEQPRQALAEYLAVSNDNNGRVWPERFDRRLVLQLVYRIGKRARVSRAFPHRFRHTFAMRFLASTGNALALQALLGHTSLIMVQRYIAACQAEIALEAHRQHSPLDALKRVARRSKDD